MVMEDEELWDIEKIVFNRYKLKSVRIGGFSEVWAAEDIEENMTVAIKRPKIDVFSNLKTDKIIDNFRREFLNHIILPKHRNVAYLHNIEILISNNVGRIPCLVMDYYEKTLKDWMIEKKDIELFCKLNCILIIMIELIEGLEFIYDKGILNHNDIKKENILLSSKGISSNNPSNIVISDFNVSSASHNDRIQKYDDLLSIVNILLEMMDQETYNRKETIIINLQKIKDRVIDNGVGCACPNSIHGNCLHKECCFKIFQVIEDYSLKGKYDRDDYCDLKNTFKGIYNTLNPNNLYKNKYTIVEFNIDDVVNRMTSVAMMYDNIRITKSIEKAEEKILHDQYYVLFNILYENAVKIEKDNPYLIYNKMLFDYKKNYHFNMELFVEELKNSTKIESSTIGKLLLARLYIYIHELEKSKDIVLKINEIELNGLDDPSKARYIYNSLGLIYCGLGRFDLSSGSFLKCIKILGENNKGIRYKINWYVSLLKEGKEEIVRNDLKYLLNDGNAKKCFENYMNLKFEKDQINSMKQDGFIEKEIEKILHLLKSVFIPNGYYLSTFVLSPEEERVALFLLSLPIPII